MRSRAVGTSMLVLLLGCTQANIVDVVPTDGSMDGALDGGARDLGGAADALDAPVDGNVPDLALADVPAPDAPLEGDALGDAGSVVHQPRNLVKESSRRLGHRALRSKIALFARQWRCRG